MTSSTPPPSVPPGRAAALTLAVGAAALLVGGLFVVRGMTFRALAAVGVDAPAAVRPVLDVLAQAGLLVLVALCLAAAVAARARGTRPLAVAGCAAVAAALAVGTSELAKLAVTELRPCHNFVVQTLAACPAGRDWSWPSNHATAAGALATAVVLLAPPWRWLAASVALAVAAARVLVGVHYAHDVAAGLVLGSAVVLLVVQVGTDRVEHLLVAAARHSRLAAHLIGRPPAAPGD